MNTNEQLAKSKELWNAFSAKYSHNLHDLGLVKPAVDQVVAKVLPLVQGKTDVKIVDVASGSCEPAMTLASALPEAEVVATDLADQMIAQGERRVQRSGLKNITCAVADGQNLPFPDASQDVVTCQYGLMFFPDYKKGVAEAARVLKPGGAYVVCVWGRFQDHTMCMLTADMMAALRPDADRMTTSGANRLADMEALTQDFRDAGFSQVTWDAYNHEMRFPPAALEHMTARNPMMQATFAEMKAAGRNNIEEEAVAELHRLVKEKGYQQADGSILLEAQLAYIITGIKP